MSNSKTLVERLAAAASSMGNVEKGGTNTHFRYSYATHNDVSETVRHALFREGVFMSLDILEHTWEDGKTNRGSLKRIHSVKFAVTFHGGGEQITVNWIGQGEDPDDKGVNKAMSNGVKYLLLKTFLIPSDDIENDVDHGSHDQRRNGGQQRQAPPKPTAPPVKMFKDLAKERQDKARAKLFAIAGELVEGEESVADAAYRLANGYLAPDKAKGRGSLSLSTEQQVAKAINHLDGLLKAKKSAEVSAETQQAAMAMSTGGGGSELAS